MFFSATTLGFYCRNINAGGIPPDAIELSDADYAALLAAQSSGMKIIAGEFGPVAIVPIKTPAELDAEQTAAALADLRAIDLASIRGLREWVAAQPGAPVQLVEHEQAAQAARGRIKP